MFQDGSVKAISSTSGALVYLVPFHAHCSKTLRVVPRHAHTESMDAKYALSPRSHPLHNARAVTPEGYLLGRPLEQAEPMLTSRRHKYTTNQSPLLRLALIWGNSSWLIATPALLASIASLLTVSHAFNSLFKVLFIFPSRYLFAIGLVPIFSFRWNLPPIWGCNPKQPDSSRACRTGQPAATDGPLTLYGSPVPRNFDRDWPRSHFSKLQFAYVPIGDSKFELFPLHSPLLRESLLVSFPPLINMLKFSG